MMNFEKWEAVMTELLRDAVRSDRQIAEAVGFSATFVGRVRRKLEDDGKLQPGKRVGHDGRRRGLPRNMTEMRERLLVLLKGKKRRKDNQELAAWVEKMTPKTVEKYLAAFENEKVFASQQGDGAVPLQAKQDKAVPVTDEEFLKWGLIAGMVEDQHWTEEKAVAIAPEVLDEVGTDERPRLIERGKGYWSRTRGA